MINLLLSDYINAFSLTKKDYSVEYKEYKGKIALADPKSCSECRDKVCFGANENQVFVVESKENITVVEIEKFFNQFRSDRPKPKNRCDLMIYFADKILFVDMYCGYQRFVEPYSNTKGFQLGKLAKVRQQIGCTIDKLNEVESIKNRIQSFKECVGLFAYRNKDNEVTGIEEQSMADFMEMADSLANPDYYTILSNGVQFHTIVYPNVYQWN